MCISAAPPFIVIAPELGVATYPLTDAITNEYVPSAAVKTKVFDVEECICPLKVADHCVLAGSPSSMSETLKDAWEGGAKTGMGICVNCAEICELLATTMSIDAEVSGIALPPVPVIPAEADQFENEIPGVGFAVSNRSSPKSS